MCCLILYSGWPSSGPAHLCCNEGRIPKDLGHWWALQTRPSSAGVGGAATLHSPQRVAVGLVPISRGETCHFCMQCINSINSYYTPAHVVRLGGSACPPNKGSYWRDCLTALNTGSWGWSGVVWRAVRHACCGLDMWRLCMQCLWRSVVCDVYTHHTLTILQWVFISHCDVFMVLCVTWHACDPIFFTGRHPPISCWSWSLKVHHSTEADSEGKHILCHCCLPEGSDCEQVLEGSNAGWM